MHGVAHRVHVLRRARVGVGEVPPQVFPQIDHVPPVDRGVVQRPVQTRIRQSSGAGTLPDRRRVAIEITTVGVHLRGQLSFMGDKRVGQHADDNGTELNGKEPDVEFGKRVGPNGRNAQDKQQPHAADDDAAPLARNLVQVGKPRRLHFGGKTNDVKGHAHGVGHVKQHAHCPAKFRPQGARDHKIRTAARHFTVGHDGGKGQDRENGHDFRDDDDEQRAQDPRLRDPPPQAKK